MTGLKLFFILNIVLIPQVVLCKGTLKILNEDTWSDMLEGEWMIEFFAPWCPACQQLAPLWNEFAQWSEDLSIKIANIDVTVNPGLSGRFMITALPTIFHVKDGVFRQYRGARDKDSFISFVEEKKWETIDPVSSWKSPQSFQMTIVAYFFRLSMMLRNIHNTLTQDYSIPYWGSYILFGIMTIVVGAFLGLLVVMAIDFLYPIQKVYVTPARENVELPEQVFEGEDVIQPDTLDGQEIRRRREAAPDT